MSTSIPVTARLKKIGEIGTGGVEDDDIGPLRLQTQDNLATKPPIYIYNICDLSHVRNQPPEFPGFSVEACPKGQKFSFKTFPGLVNERYCKPGTQEYYYKQVDGRKYATSLLNPDCFPGTDWRAQLAEGSTGNDDMSGMNMNAVGVFWSELAPDDAGLPAQLKLFRARVDRTMDALVKEGNRLNAGGQLGLISPMMHFAMEYFGLQATWHMSHRHKTPCTNCGELIMEGIAFHKTEFGTMCVVDWQQAYEAGAVKKDDVPDGKRWWDAEAAAPEAGRAPKKPRARAAG